MTTTLGGVSVLDLSLGPAGGLATMILSDFGAEVIKIEPLGGDPFRRIPSSPMWLRGKKSVELDLNAAAAIEKLQGLVAGADVIVVGQRTVDAEKQGCDYQTLSRINPRLIYCQITGFGDEGPYAHFPPYEAVVTAKGGRMKELSGIPGKPGPVFTGVQVATHAASQSALAGILAALVERRKSGAGQMIRTSLLQGLMPFEQHGALRHQVAARTPKPQVAPKPDPYEWIANLDFHPFQAGDGRWLQTGNLMPHLFQNFLKITGLDKVIENPPYDEPRYSWSPDTREAFRDIMMLRMQEKTSDEWMKLFLENGNVVAHTFMTAEEALDDPDIVENGHVIEMANIRQLGPLAKLTETPAQIETPAPEPGQHNHLLDAVEAPNAAESSGPAANTEAPLAGVTVLEFATIIAAPFGASLLADMGARVIKVEPIGGDPFRGQTKEEMATRVNCSKESIVIDLKTDRGKDIVRRLIQDADILIHNYRHGVPEKLGIGYDQAKTFNPGIVYLQSNGYGTQGPSVLRPSAAPVPGAALGGVVYQVGGLDDRELLDLKGLRETARRLARANDVVPDPRTGM
ncbi:MAG: CoA transferase, partial [Candidatus Hydrogenedentes bacterium]|nr:CoA transferase [Candidatus Hydrogenedentota bacterium]